MIKPFVVAVLAAAGLATSACGAGSPTTQPTNTVTITAPASTSTTPASAQSSASTQPAVTTSSSDPAGNTGTSGCLTRYLNGSVGLGQGAAGSTYITIVFKNLNNVPCTLYGFPGVAQAAGTPVTDVGQPSTEDHSTARKLVTLQPGGYANATLRIGQALVYSTATCKPVSAQWLAVIPPNQFVPLYIHYSSTACKAVTVHLLSVTAVRPGNGG